MKIASRDDGTQKVTLLTDGSEPLSQDQAIAALGDRAQRYTVVTWVVGKPLGPYGVSQANKRRNAEAQESK